MLTFNSSDTPALIAPIRQISTIRSKKDKMKPVIANPRGDLKSPINDNKKPKNHKIQPTTGTQEKNNAISARTNPAVPQPLDCF